MVFIKKELTWITTCSSSKKSKLTVMQNKAHTCKFLSSFRPGIDSNLKLEFGGWLGEGTGFILLNLNANISLIQLPSLAHFSSLHYYAWLDSFTDLLTNKFNSVQSYWGIEAQSSWKHLLTLIISSICFKVLLSSGSRCSQDRERE